MLRHAIDDLNLALTRQKLWLYAGAILALVAVEGFFRYRMRMILIGRQPRDGVRASGTRSSST